MSITVYDYAIVGTGAAGFQLALAMLEDDFFRDKRIVLIDPDKKEANDKTWCFWEQGKGKWDDLITQSWDTADFYGRKHLQLSFDPYRYKMLRSINFYNHATSKLEAASKVTFLHEEVLQITESPSNAVVRTTTQEMNVKICFDSRIPKEYNNANDKHIRILQHFKGCQLSFEEDLFDPSAFTMMDFRLKHQDQTSFMYILPTSKNEALLEYTLFTGEVLPEAEYDRLIKEYIFAYLSPTATYIITETEKGIIPMTTFPFHQFHTKRIIKIGTAGGWVRSSTGYSFKNVGRYVQKMVHNLKSNRHPTHQLFQKKYRLYDTLLLDILDRANEKGATLFEEMYTKNKATQVLKFLDGQTSFWEDFRIIASFAPAPFLKSIFRRYLKFW